MSRLDEIKTKDSELVEKIKELEKERDKLKTEELNIKKNENKEWLNYLMGNKNFVLSLFQHSRTSCSDNNVSNGIDDSGYCRCSKCALIEILNGEWGCNYKPVFSIDLVQVEES